MSTVWNKSEMVPVFWRNYWTLSSCLHTQISNTSCHFATVYSKKSLGPTNFFLSVYKDKSHSGRDGHV